MQAPGKAEKLHILAQILSQSIYRLKCLQTNLSDKWGTMQWSWALSLNWNLFLAIINWKSYLKQWIYYRYGVKGGYQTISGTHADVLVSLNPGSPLRLLSVLKEYLPFRSWTPPTEPKRPCSSPWWPWTSPPASIAVTAWLIRGAPGAACILFWLRSNVNLIEPWLWFFHHRC